MTTTDLVTTSTPDPLALIERSELGDATKVKYTRVLTEYLDTGAELRDADALRVFAGTLSTSRKAQLKAAVRLFTDALRDDMNAQAEPLADNAVELEARMAQTDRNISALQNAIKVKTPKGTKAHTWLSKQQVKRLSNEIGNGIVGARDRAVIGLLVAAGLRREEAVALTFDDIKLQPIGERMRTVLDVAGKGDKARVVPISDKLANDLDAWGKFVGHTGRICRSLGRLREPGESMSGVALFKLVQKYGKRIGKPELAPHDLRRSYAQIGFEDGTPITQLSKLLGHASVATTQKYLNLDLDLTVTASDFIPW